MEEIYKEVYFDEYCTICEYFKKCDGYDPCNDCLENPVNAYSHKPVNFKEEKRK